MLKIGITGGIGSGKTVISRLFELLGIPVFYADEQAKSLMHTDGLLINGIVRAFGEQSYTEGALNRKHISDIVFKDEEQLATLNALVHPAVFRAFDAWVLQQNSPYVMKEAALLFESGSYKLCDKTILIVSTEPVKIERVMKRSGITAEDVRNRMNKQFTDEQAIPLADFIIRNDETQLLIPQVIHLHEQFLALTHS